MQRTLLALVLLGIVPSFAPAADDLAATFLAPPESAKPLTWWHWLDGNITREGITADLEAIKQAGLGGAYLFDCAVGMPRGPVRFMEPQWLEMIDHTLREAERLGIKFGVHNCDGFSQSGGPWMTAEKSMKELTWTTADAQGPGTFDQVLALPESREDFYRDIAVIAFPLPRGERLTGPNRSTAIHGSLPPAELAKLTDGDEKSTAAFPVSERPHEIELVLPAPRTVRSVVCRNADPHRWEEDFPIQLSVSDDGKHFRPAGSFTVNWDFKNGGSITAACNATGKVFRLTFQNPWRIAIGEIELSETARAHFAESKAARFRSRGHGAERRHFDNYPGPDRAQALPTELVVARQQVRNLSSQLAADGRLRWEIPAGRWRIVRLGFTSNGHRVAPATPEGRGLECDKLDPEAVKFHLEQYVGKLLRRAGPAAGKTFAAMEVDSWECGIQNWTAGLERRFQQRMGYDLLTFTPALVEGWIVDNPDITERALWDWRRFLADQFSENYFAVVADFAKRRGLTYVGESNGRQAYHYDIAYMRNSEVTMGEFWIDQGPGQGVRVDNKLAASVAHTTGKRVVAAEAYTAGPQAAAWQNHPFSLKALGDRAFCAGANQFVFHTFAHQPYRATGPGFTFASWGLNFNRGNTWWPVAHAWMEYLSRCNFLLQEGHSFCDVLFYVGEDVPNRVAWRDELHPVLPSGYDFDACDTQALLDARAEQGQIVLPSGTRYRVLLLPNLTTMRPPVLRKVRDLTLAGAIVLGPRPAQSPSLTELGEGDACVISLAGELWGPAADGPVDRKIGQGRLFDRLPFDEVFRRIGLPADFVGKPTAADAQVLYIHRRIGKADVYFLSNQRDRVEMLDATFRVAGRAPELWDPTDGRARALPQWHSKGGTTSLPLRLDRFGSAFVVFHREADVGPGKNWLETEPAQTVAGPWQVSFPSGFGAPLSANFERLKSLSENSVPGIRYFAGTATYRKSDFTIPTAALQSPGKFYVDLGEVAVIAQVALNGRDLGIVWKPPYRLPIGNAARPGNNELVIRVTTLWPNRMIGDASLPDDVPWNRAVRRGAYPAKWPEWLTEGRERPSGRIAFCTRKDVYTKDSPLLPAGLFGPVTLQREIQPKPK